MKKEIFQYAGLALALIAIVGSAIAGFFPGPESVKPWEGVEIPYYAFFASVGIVMAVLVSIWPNLWQRIQKLWEAKWKQKSQ